MWFILVTWLLIGLFISNSQLQTSDAPLSIRQYAGAHHITWQHLVYQVLSSKVPGYLADDIHLAQKVLLAPSGPLRGESALSLVFTVILVTDVLLQLDHVSGTTYLQVCETRKSAAQNSENNWKQNIHVSHGLRRIVTFLIIAPYKYSYLLTYLLTYCSAWYSAYRGMHFIGRWRWANDIAENWYRRYFRSCIDIYKGDIDPPLWVALSLNILCRF